MYVRLAFAVAAHLDTEILAIDEVLAVGDAEFQRKSLAKMRDAARDGRTVLFVSHQMHTVADLCTSALFLQGGRLDHHGRRRDGDARYRATFDDFAVAQREAARRPGTGELRATRSQPERRVDSADDKVIEIDLDANPESSLPYYVSATSPTRTVPSSRSATRGSSAPGSTRACRTSSPSRSTISGCGRVDTRSTSSSAAPESWTRGRAAASSRCSRPALSRDGLRRRVRDRHPCSPTSATRRAEPGARLRRDGPNGSARNPTGAMRSESQASTAAARKRRAFR